MPAHRGGATPLFSLKEIVDLAGECRARARPASGRSAPARRGDRRAAGGAQRLPHHGDQDRGGLRGGDEAARTTGCAAGGDPGLGGTGALARARHAHRDRRPGASDLEPDAGPCGGTRAGVARRVVRDRRGGARRRGRRLHVHRRPRADRPSCVARAGRARQRRRLVGAVRTRARCRARRRGVAVRRPAGVDLERVGRLPAGRRGEGNRARPHPRRAGRAPPRRASGTERRRRAHALQVARARGRGSRRRRRSAWPVHASRASASRSRSDRARGDRARAVDHRRRRLGEPAAPPVRRRAVRGVAQARMPAADRLVQAPRRDERDPSGRPGGVARRCVDNERRQHGPGCLLGRA